MNTDMVRITWVDAKFCTGLHDRDSVLEHKLDVFASLGHLISQDTRTTIIAAEKNDSDQYRDITLIPTGSILSLENLAPVV